MSIRKVLELAGCFTSFLKSTDEQPLSVCPAMEGLTDKTQVCTGAEATRQVILKILLHVIVKMTGAVRAAPLLRENKFSIW
jgi:hypothetical protein